MGGTTPLYSWGRLLAGACCKCGPMSSCKIQRYDCRKAGHHCANCRCRGCANVPSTRLEVQDQNLDRGGGSRKGACREGTAEAV